MTLASRRPRGVAGERGARSGQSSPAQVAGGDASPFRSQPIDPGGTGQNKNAPVFGRKMAANFQAAGLPAPMTAGYNTLV
jgi:hypothetical protein